MSGDVAPAVVQRSAVLVVEPVSGIESQELDFGAFDESNRART